MGQSHFHVTPDLVLRAYRAGLFPMAEARHSDTLYWLDPEQRGVLPLDRFHLSRRLLRTVLNTGLQVTSDTDFGATIAACAENRAERRETWINTEIESLFNELHRMGAAHSVECRHGNVLVGGLYGVAVGGAFFGESMFSHVRDASKIALVHLVARLRLGGFTLLDTQFLTAHLAQFGAEEWPRDRYKAALQEAVDRNASWIAQPPEAGLHEAFKHIAGGPEAI
jgi:leucyl/phenylalanyl-tRNA--protein transferase